jgi:hypothetical protein
LRLSDQAAICRLFLKMQLRPSPRGSALVFTLGKFAGG